MLWKKDFLLISPIIQAHTLMKNATTTTEVQYSARQDKPFTPPTLTHLTYTEMLKCTELNFQTPSLKKERI